MKSRHIIPLLGLLGSTALSAVLLIYVIAAPLSTWTGMSEQSLTLAGLVLLCVLQLCRLYLILHDRDIATNLINARSKVDPQSEKS